MKQIVAIYLSRLASLLNQANKPLQRSNCLGIKGPTTLPQAHPEAQTRNSQPVNGAWAVSTTSAVM